MRPIVFATTALLLAGCAYPHSQTEQGTAAGQLYFPGAPAGTHVMVDGQDVGMASSFDGRQTLSVSPGTHRVVVGSGANVFIDKKYYVDAGAKVAVRNE
jgi:hypothetical protein